MTAASLNVELASRRVAAFLLLVQALLLLVPALQDERLAEPDEANYVEVALRMPRTAFDPGSYLHGSLPYAVLAAQTAALYLLDRARGAVVGPTAFVQQYLARPGRLLVAARIVVLLVFLLAMWAFQRVAFLLIADPWLAVLAGALVQTSPGILFCCWYVKAEAFVLAGLAMALLFLTRAGAVPGGPARDRTRRLLVAGSAVSFGLAVASGYLAVLAAPAFALMLWRMSSAPRDRWAGLLGYGIVSVFAFAMAEPYGILHMERLLGEVSRQAQYVASSSVSTVPLGARILRDYYLAPLGVPTSAAVLGILPASAAVRRATGARWPWFLLVYPALTVAYFLPSRGAFFRYFAPTLPFLLLFAMVVWDRLIPDGRVARRLSLVVGAVLALAQADRSWAFGAYLAQPSAANRAKDWITRNVPPGSPILVEGLVVDQVFWCPQLPKTRPALERELEAVRSRGGTGALVKLKMEACCPDDAPAFDAVEVPSVEGTSTPWAGFAVLCRDDDSPFHPVWNVEAVALEHARRERSGHRRRWLETGSCRLVHSEEPSVRTPGPLIDAVDFSSFIERGQGPRLSGPVVSVFRCGATPLP